ncbi:MAG: ABC transporter ATP-binding protein [Phycisphaerae bacterium]
MSDKVLAYSEPRQSTLYDRRKQAPTPRAANNAAYWRMLALVWPHRLAMLWGLLLGIGAAFSYAASLGGIMPVLKVVVEQESLHAWLLERAQRAGDTFGPVLTWLAGFLPSENSADARLQTVYWLLGVLLAMNVIGNLCRVYSQYLVLWASQRAMMDLRRKMYRKSLHVQVLDLTGEVSGRISQFMSDSREMFIGITTLFGKVAREPLKAICVFGVALFIDWRLTLLVVAIAPPALGILWYFGRKVRKAAVRLLEGYGIMLGALEETLHGIDAVKAHGREAHERRRMWGLERRMMRESLRLAWIEAISSPLIEVVGISIAAGAIVWLAGQTLHGQMESSHLMTMVLLIAAMLDPIRKVANVYNVVQRSGGAAVRVFGFLDQEEEHSPERPKALTGTGPREVRFENLEFRYSAEQSPPALSNVSLHVKAGECVALVGPNGSGKSTILKMLPRFLKPQQGRILVDGIDVTQLSLRSLRLEISVVAQRPVIFARSIRENIAYGYPDATDEQVRDAARKAFAAEFIDNLPEKYDTVAGEFGTSLSGGQRQRLAIARAFLKPASILVFDEATSEIDAESEQKIHEALDELRRGKTTFLIAHRHTVMDLADRIVVMDGGRIVDVGTREELLARCPLFVALYRSPGA